VTIASEIASPEDLAAELERNGYLADPGLAISLFLAMKLPQPLLLEGEAGVGKTQAAKSLAQLLDTPLIRLQCYEGIDASEALYEWNYPRQLLSIRVAESQGLELEEHSLFSRDYLIDRPLMQAIEHEGPNPAVLLIDEIDRADEEFEAFLFEMLAECTVTVPELGTIRAKVPPIVILTSNRTRDLHDALKRRCLYHWIEYPDIEQATKIIHTKLPDTNPLLIQEISAAVQRIRSLDIQKPPGIAEAIDWAHAAQLLGVKALTPEEIDTTLGSIVKYREDRAVVLEKGLDWVAGE
jgi:MoxR-like ATPase